MNNLLELGGSVDLIATAICDFDTPTKHYNRGDIVLNLTDIQAQAILATKNSQAKNDAVVLEFGFVQFNSIQCACVPLEQQIFSLLGIEEIRQSIIIQERLLHLAGTKVLLPTHYISNENSIRIQGIEHFQLNNVNDTLSSIVSEEFENDRIYDVQYEVSEIRHKIPLDSFEADIPYLKLQLSIHGNGDKKTVDGYLVIEKARMHYLPVLQFASNGVSHCVLRFTIIDDENKPSLVI